MKKVLVPVYQPIIDLLTGRVTYFEALARTRNTSKGGHVELLDLGENYGFIHLVDIGILTQVIRAMEDRPCVNVSVNVSVMTLENALGEYLALVFSNMDLASRLVFEITETVQVSDYNKIDRFVRAVRLIGGRVAVDDLGDGFATMDLVERIRPDFVKFPCSMVEKIARSNVQPMTDLRTRIEQLGGAVIAEYVDSQEKCDLLMQAGVRHGQGYYFGVPDAHLACSRRDKAHATANCLVPGRSHMPVPQHTACC